MVNEGKNGRGNPRAETPVGRPCRTLQAVGRNLNYIGNAVGGHWRNGGGQWD